MQICKKETNELKMYPAAHFFPHNPIGIDEEKDKADKEKGRSYMGRPGEGCPGSITGQPAKDPEA